MYGFVYDQSHSCNVRNLRAVDRYSHELSRDVESRSNMNRSVDEADLTLYYAMHKNALTRCPHQKEEDLHMKSFLKRSAVKQLACFLLAVIITVGFVPLPAQASTTKYNYKITTLKQKKWVTAKGNTSNYNQDKDAWTDTYYLYKISVPANSFIRVDSKSKSKTIRIYKSINMKDNPYNSDSIFYLDDATLYRRVLPRGAYYILADEGTTFRWQSATTKNPTNFCRARAAKLKAGYKKWEVFNYGYEFDRWYRISLTSRKPITVTMKQMDIRWGVNFKVYNSRGYSITCNELNDTNYRTAVLSKGTYYIRVGRYAYWEYGDESYNFADRICQFWWR